MQLRKSVLAGRFFRALALLALTMGAAYGAFFYWSHAPIAMLSPRAEIAIPPGAGLGQVIATLREGGILIPKLPAKLLARQMGVANRLKSGIYLFEAPITPFALLSKLHLGEVLQVEIVIPEGWTFRQIRARLNASADLRHDTANLSDEEILRQIGASEINPEGLFFPDTYWVDKAGSDLTVFKSAYRAMQTLLQRAWNTRTPDLPIRTPYEALILASIVEKETGRPEDRPLIASVFVNRLKLGMRLQTDPTVIYGMGQSFNGNLRRQDLVRDTPYNTYARLGLPPGPISMPGKESIDASLNPPRNNMLYFVARGDGSSEFSSTIEAHNRAVNKYQRGIR